MFDPEILESVQIYLSNLSTHYIISILLSCVSIIATMYYSKSNGPIPTTETESSDTHAPSEENRDDPAELEPKRPGTLKKLERPSILSDTSPVMVKHFLKADIPSKLLTKEQLRRERLIEQQQLEAIFKLLQKQEESSIEELHDQMELYRKKADVSEENP